MFGSSKREAGLFEDDVLVSKAGEQISKILVFILCLLIFGFKVSNFVLQLYLAESWR